MREGGLPGLVVDVVWICVGAGPNALCATPDGRRVLVSNADGDTVSVVDVGAAVVAATIRVGGSPAGVAVAGDVPRAYVVVRGEVRTALTRLVVVDPLVSAVIGAVRLVGSPGDVATTGDGRLVFASDRAAGTVSVVDPGTGPVGDVRLDPGTRPGPMDLSRDGQRLYLSGDMGGEGIVAVADTDRRVVVDRLRVGFRPGRLALAPDGRRLYVASPADGAVWVIDTAGVLTPVGAPIAVGDGVSGVAVSPDGRLLYTTDGKTTVRIFDTGSGLAAAQPVVVGDTPLDVVAGPDGRRAFVSVSGSGSMAILTVTSPASSSRVRRA